MWEERLRTEATSHHPPFRVRNGRVSSSKDGGWTIRRTQYVKSVRLEVEDLDYMVKRKKERVCEKYCAEMEPALGATQGGSTVRNGVLNGIGGGVEGHGGQRVRCKGYLRGMVVENVRKGR